MTVFGLIGALIVVLLAALAILMIHLARQPQRVPPARPRATYREALEHLGDDADTVFPARDGS